MEVDLVPTLANGGTENNASGDSYFESYQDIAVHRLMLEDKPRTLAYKDAIFKNRNRIEGKIILDVGSGTGVLSIFCAQAGAKKVHAVEASNMAELSKSVVKDNNLCDVIEVHHCSLEDLELSEKVDVIISEWMGFYLFHEGMLDTVLLARDRFLKEDGFIMPESADLWVAPCELPKYFDFWDDVYGINMSSVGKEDRRTKKYPVVTDIKESQILGDESVVKSVVLSSVKSEELDAINFKTVVPSKRDGKYGGLCLWFVCNFFTSEDEVISLSTRPGEEATHWKQIGIVFPFTLEVQEKDPIAFQLDLKRRPDNRRRYTIEVTMLDPEKEEHSAPCGCNMTRCIVIQKYLEQHTTNKDLESSDEGEES